MSISMCVCATTLATWKRGRVFYRVFFIGTLNIVRQFSFLFSANARILFKTTAMERFFYSIIASCLIGFLASRSLTLSISKKKMTVSTLSLSSPVVIDPAESHPLREVRRCSVDVVAVGDGGSRCAPSSRSRRWRGRRLFVPLFAAVVWADPARPPNNITTSRPPEV